MQRLLGAFSSLSCHDNSLCTSLKIPPRGEPSSALVLCRLRGWQWLLQHQRTCTKARSPPIMVATVSECWEIVQGMQTHNLVLVRLVTKQTSLLKFYFLLRQTAGSAKSKCEGATAVQHRGPCSELRAEAVTVARTMMEVAIQR